MNNDNNLKKLQLQQINIIKIYLKTRNKKWIDIFNRLSNPKSVIQIRFENIFSDIQSIIKKQK